MQPALRLIDAPFSPGDPNDVEVIQRSAVDDPNNRANKRGNIDIADPDGREVIRWLDEKSGLRCGHNRNPAQEEAISYGDEKYCGHPDEQQKGLPHMTPISPDRHLGVRSDRHQSANE